MRCVVREPHASQKDSAETRWSRHREPVHIIQGDLISSSCVTFDLWSGCPCDIGVLFSERGGIGSPLQPLGLQSRERSSKYYPS